MKSKEVFVSEIDAGLYPLCAIVTLGCLYKMQQVVVTSGNYWNWVLPLITLGLMLSVLLQTRYEVHSSHLLIRCGCYHRTFPLKSDITIHTVQSLDFAPALSLDKLQICSGNQTVEVSPRNRHAFIHAIKRATADGPVVDI